MTVSERLYHLPAARSDDQRAYMADLEERGVCVMCDRKGAEIEGEHWFVKANDFPYEGTAAHYLIVPYEHVRSFEELPDEAGAELWALKRRLKERLGDPVATATVERSGDMRYNGGSVAHLHIHFVALDEAPSRTVRFKVSAEA